jgi:hypothetical protein
MPEFPKRRKTSMSNPKTSRIRIARKKRNLAPFTPSKVIVVSLTLGVIALTAIIYGFDGTIKASLGAEGVQFTVNGCKFR